MGLCDTMRKGHNFQFYFLHTFLNYALPGLQTY
jgi:hypothetical protein